MPWGQRVSRAWEQVRVSRPRPPVDPRRSADEALLRFVLGRPDPAVTSLDLTDEEDPVSDDEARSRPQGDAHTHTWYDVDCTCAVGADHVTPPLPGGGDR